MRYIYADIFFLVNLCFNFSLLYLAGRLSRLAPSGRRLTLGALVGALYSAASLYPGLAFLMTLPAKLLAAALMVAIAFPTTLVRRFLFTLGYFCLTAFAVGGASLAVGYLLGGVGPAQGGSGPLGADVVLPAALAAGVLLHWAVMAARERERVLAWCVTCRVMVDGRTVEFPALVDTGNRLRDPLSNAPVVIAEYPALGALLPGSFATVWDRALDDPDLAAIVETLETAWAARVRVVPFSSIGRASGLLVGFRADEVAVGEPEDAVRRRDVIVCVSPRPLSSEGGYRALVPPEVLEPETAAGVG